LDVFPEWSDAVQDTDVVPSGKVEPEPGLQEMVGDPSSASLAVGANVTAVPLPEAASTVIGPGTDRVGAVLSCTVTSKVPGAEGLPAESIAVQETCVVPIGKVAPDVWVQEMVGDAVIASLAVTE
jgi:hypothetical protein